MFYIFCIVWHLTEMDVYLKYHQNSESEVVMCQRRIAMIIKLGTVIEQLPCVDVSFARNGLLLE